MPEVCAVIFFKGLFICKLFPSIFSTFFMPVREEIYKNVFH